MTAYITFAFLLLLALTAEAYNQSSYSCGWFSSQQVNLYIPPSVSRQELDSYSSADGCCRCNSYPGDFVALDNGWPAADFHFRTFTCPSGDDYCKSASGSVQANIDLLKCRNPIGMDCSWYENCLAKYHSCQSDASGYAIQQGKQLCEKYQKYFRVVSPASQKWITGIKACLQTSLADLIGTNLPCSDLENKASNLWKKCYVDSGLCDLSWFEWFQVINTVGDRFVWSDTNNSGLLDNCNSGKVNEFKKIFMSNHKSWLEGSVIGY